MAYPIINKVTGKVTGWLCCVCNEVAVQHDGGVCARCQDAQPPEPLEDAQVVDRLANHDLARYGRWCDAWKVMKCIDIGNALSGLITAPTFDPELFVREGLALRARFEADVAEQVRHDPKLFALAEVKS